MKLTNKVFALCAIAGLLLTVPAGAADGDAGKKSAKETAVDAELNADIRKMLKLSGQGELGVQAMGQLLSSFKVAMPQVPESFWDDFLKEANADELVEMVVPIYAKHFTRADIKAMVDFYNSPVGKKLIAKQPVIMQESMAAGQIWGEGISKRLMKRLAEKGYKT